MVLGVLTTACGSSGPDRLSGQAATIHAGECSRRTGEQVTIYSGRTEHLIEPILDAFERRTGHEVRVRWGSSTDLAARIDEEGDGADADGFPSRSPGSDGFSEANDRLGSVEPDMQALVAEAYRSATGRCSPNKRTIVDAVAFAA